MTKAGIERKATCRALFSKLLYLARARTPPSPEALPVSSAPAGAPGKQIFLYVAALLRAGA